MRAIVAKALTKVAVPPRSKIGLCIWWSFERISKLLQGKSSLKAVVVLALRYMMADLRIPMEQALARNRSMATTCRYFDRAGELQAVATASLGSLLVGV